MSYATRVYRQRNAHTHDETSKESFFAKQYDISGPLKKNTFFQAKLSVNQPGDRYEKEADDVANAVVNRSSQTHVVLQKKISGIQSSSISMEDEEPGTNDARMLEDKEIQEKPDIQRMCPECEKEKKKEVQQKMAPEEKKEKEKIQKKAESHSSGSPVLASRIDTSAGTGKHLPAKTLADMNSSFGVDFSDISIHTGADAVEMNKELSAQAFTYGKDIYFNSGKYNPETTGGKQLLAHELTHVIQQRQGISKKKLSEEEKQANLVSKKYATNERLQSAFDNSPLLKIGECNEGVRLIQEGLVADGFSMPKSTMDNGELDGNFGTETYNTIMNFQTKHKIGRDGIVGRDTLQQLDDLAVANDLTATVHELPIDCRPIAPLPKPPKPSPVTDCVMHAVYANQRTVNFCSSTSCGVAVRFDVQKITRNGPKCPSDFSGKTLNERVTIIDDKTSCPTKPQVVTGSAPIEKDGTLINATDTYGICFPKKLAADFMEFGFFSCDAGMKQELMIDGKVFEVRIISLHVNFDVDFSEPQFISCSGFGFVT